MGFEYSYVINRSLDGIATIQIYQLAGHNITASNDRDDTVCDIFRRCNGIQCGSRPNKGLNPTSSIGDFLFA